MKVLLKRTHKVLVPHSKPELVLPDWVSYLSTTDDQARRWAAYQKRQRKVNVRLIRLSDGKELSLG